MKLIKKLFALFSPLELVILMVSITISTLLVVPAFSKDTQKKTPILLFPTEKVYNTDGGRPIEVFDTSFFVVYEEVEEQTQNDIKAILNEYLISYHKLFDRHND